jgi:hypothetical protein
MIKAELLWLFTKKGNDKFKLEVEFALVNKGINK